MSKEFYYEETIAESNKNYKMGLTVEQIILLAKDVAMSHEMWGEYSGARYIPDPKETESQRKIKVLEKELKQKEIMIANAEMKMSEKHRVARSQVSLTDEGHFEIRAR